MIIRPFLSLTALAFVALCALAAVRADPPPGSVNAGGIVNLPGPPSIGGFVGSLGQSVVGVSTDGKMWAGLIVPDNPPSISSFTPAQGPEGTTVTLVGSGFTDASSVKFGNGTSAIPLITQNGTQLVVVVPVGAATGPITVTTPIGSVTSSAPFTVLPTIVAIDPTGGPAATQVTITGTSFVGATAVKFNGVAAASFTVDSPTQIRAVAPAHLTTGPISVITPSGTAVSSQNFSALLRPPNDDFVNAQKIAADRGTVAGTNVGATSEPGEPIHAGDGGGHSVWYSWTQFAYDGPVTVDTRGSNFDTVLAVYTGNSVRALTPVASNDDAFADRTSSVQFTMQNGIQYYIAVDGAGGAQGNLKLNWAINPAPAVTIRWTKTLGATTASGNWNNAANWTDATGHHRIPTPSDNVAIDRPGLYAVTLDVDVTVAGLAALGTTTGRQNLLLNSHTLTVTGTSVVRATGDINLSAGTLINTGILTVSGAFDWTGGKLSGAGSTTVTSSGHLTISGAAVKSLSQQQVFNFGTVQWVGAGGIRAGSGAAIVNNRLFQVQTDAPFNWDGQLPRPTVTNVGGSTFTKAVAAGAQIAARLTGRIAGTGETAFNNVAFSNLQGQVSVQAGTLKLNGGGEGSGTFTAAAASKVTFTNGYLCDRQLTTFNGPGTTRVEGGSFTINDAHHSVNVRIQNFELASGAVTGSDNLNIGAVTTAGDIGTRATAPSVFTWTSGVMSGTGQTNIATGARVSISGTGRKDLLGRTVNNSGIVNWDAAIPIRTGSGAIINNNGIFNARNGATLSYNGVGHLLTFNNTGALNPGDAPVPTAALTRENDPRLLNSAPGIGTLTLGGAFAQSLTGALNIQVGGALTGQCDQLRVQSTATLGGTLNVSLANNYKPKLGATFQVMSYTAHTGSFHAVKVPPLATGLTWRTDVKANGVFLVVVATTTRSVAPASAVKLSTVQADATHSRLQLWFNGALEAEAAADASHYQVQVNGQSVTIESASYNAVQRCVVLALPAGALRVGDQVTIAWSGLQDAAGLSLSVQPNRATAR